MCWVFCWAVLVAGVGRWRCGRFGMWWPGGSVLGLARTVRIDVGGVGELDPEGS